jgi:flagellar motility protein MotE (MotC chaperone)
MKLLKKLGLALMIVLAINFLAVLAAAGYLFSSGALSKDKLGEIGKVMYPAPTSQPATQPAAVADATTQPIMRIDEFLGATAGKTAAEQLAFMQQAFDRQMALLDRQRQELLDLRRQVELARSQFLKDKGALEDREKKVAAREQAMDAKVVDKGFTETLKLYNAMTTKQVKDIFAQLDDDTVVRYLQAMDARRASRVLGEFKTPEELKRAQALLELMRKKDAPPAASTANGASGSRQGAAEPAGPTGRAGGAGAQPTAQR